MLCVQLACEAGLWHLCACSLSSRLELPVKYIRTLAGASVVTLAQGLVWLKSELESLVQENPAQEAACSAVYACASFCGAKVLWP